MRTETHMNDGIAGAAIFSDCNRYRYMLQRIWGRDGDMCGWIMLNPSTADASIDDPTIRRCMGFARGWGYRGIVVVNLFSLRATDPRELSAADMPVCPMRKTDKPDFPDMSLWAALVGCKVTVAAWGAHRMAAERGRELVKSMRMFGMRLHCLGTTKDGHPRHPLYVKGDQPLSIYPVSKAEGCTTHE